MHGRRADSVAMMPDAGDLGGDLAAALAGRAEGLQLALQPICAAATLAPVCYEALLRWEHPEYGAIPPMTTLAAADAVGRSIALDAWAVVAAFRLRAAWPAGGPYLAVNLSAAGIRSGHVAPMIRAALDTTGADPRGLLLEMPEATVGADIPAARAAAAALRGFGIAVALDDFGGSHGSARILRDIAFAAVKIDPALTEGIEEAGPDGDRARAMLSAVVDMAHAMGATVIAEAVESVGQMRALREAGCDALQGWLLGRPNLEMT